MAGSLPHDNNPQQKPDAPLRIALLDHDEEARASLREISRAKQREWELEIHSAADGAVPGNSDSASSHPQVTLAAIGAAPLRSVEALFGVKLAWPRTRVIALLQPAHARLAFAAILAGADGCLIKPLARHDLACVVTMAAQGHPTVCMDALTAMLGEIRRLGLALGAASLTSRERQIVLLLAEGLTNCEIASRLGTATSTVCEHLKRLYNKLGVHDHRSALTRALGAIADVQPRGGVPLGGERVSPKCPPY